MTEEALVLLPRTACKPSGFSEYDNLTGYVDRTYTTTWHDDKGNLWRKTCTIINLGRPDRGVPVDPDTLLTSEEWGKERNGNPSPTYAHVAARAAAIRRDAERELEIVAYLKEHGAEQIRVIARAFNMSRDRLAEHIYKREGTVYVRTGKVGKATLWGVINA